MTNPHGEEGGPLPSDTTEVVRFNFDILCPWCYQTSRWVRDLAERGEITVGWGVFSLEIQNFAKPIEEFEPERARGVPALRTALAVRDAVGEDACGAFYAAAGERYFQRLEPLHEPATLQGALEEAGLDPSWYDKAVGDPATWEQVRAEHDELASQTRSFGVPTIRLDAGAGPAIFGPVFSEPPAGDDVVEMWRHVLWLTRYGSFHELKRERDTGPDLPYWHRVQAERAAQRAASAS